MANINLASYPNSRVKPRAATSQASIINRVLASTSNTSGDVLTDGGVVTTNGNTLLRSADPDRTYIELQNTSETENMVYAYLDKPGMNEDNAFLLRAGASISLENKGELYAKSLSGVNIKVVMDEGRG